MPISVYHLESDGTVPVSVTEGGYFAVPNGSPSPQDWDLLGVTVSPSGFTDVVSVAALTAYLTQAAADHGWAADPDGEPFNPAVASEWLWARQ